jgi:hypothetical protein
MKFVVFYYGFVFVIIFTEIVHSSHEFFILINNHHFLVFDRLWTNLIVHNVINMPNVVDILSVKILVIQSVIDENLKGRLFAKWTFVIFLLKRLLILFRFLVYRLLVLGV